MASLFREPDADFPSAMAVNHCPIRWLCFWVICSVMLWL